MRDKPDEGWDFQLAESLKGLSWNLLEPSEVRINADIKDGGMMLIAALAHSCLIPIIAFMTIYN